MAAATCQSVHAPAAAPVPPMSKAQQSRRRADAGAVWMILTGILTASFLLPLPVKDGSIGHLPSICLFYNLTGLPCPGCGLTRAFVCLGHGRWQEALHWHPFGWLVYGVCLLLWIRSGLFWRRGVLLWPLSSRAVTRLSWSAAAVLLLTGIARIGWLTTHGLQFN